MKEEGWNFAAKLWQRDWNQECNWVHTLELLLISRKLEVMKYQIEGNWNFVKWLKRVGSNENCVKGFPFIFGETKPSLYSFTSWLLLPSPFSRVENIIVDTIFPLRLSNIPFENATTIFASAYNTSILNHIWKHVCTCCPFPFPF